MRVGYIYRDNFNCDFLKKEKLNPYILSISKELRKNKFPPYRKLSDISMVFVSVKEIRSLNRKFRNIDKATDVLSFESDEDGAGYLGDIVLCPEVIQKYARKFSEEFERELIRDIIHGIMHLLGADHKHSLNMVEPMFVLQEKILDKVYDNINRIR